MIPSRPRPRCVLAVAVTATLLAGCGNDSGDNSTATTPKRVAAEPGKAPRPSTRPAGRTVRLDGRPEGIVGDATTGLFAIIQRAPFRLALFDAGTRKVVKTVELPGAGRHLSLARPGGPVLVGAESANELVEVALPSGRTVRTVKTGNHPHDAAEADGRVWVADELGATVSVIRGDSVVRTIRSGFPQPAGVAVAGGNVGIVDVQGYDLSLFNAKTLRKVGLAPAGDGPTHVRAIGERFVVLDTRGDQLLVFRATPKPKLVGRLKLPGKPYGLAVDPSHQRVWATLTSFNQVAAIDLDGDRPRRVATYPSVRQPDTVGVNPKTGRVVVVGRTDGELQVIEPRLDDGR